MNSVANIQFLAEGGKITETIRIELRELGPPRPTFLIVQETPEQKSYYEKFNTELYKLAEWICGCPQQNALFCYICIVMSDKHADKFYGDSYYWVIYGLTTGLTNKCKLSEKIYQHKRTPQHKAFSLDYALLGESGVLQHLSHEFVLNVTHHNEKVRINRYILSKLIDTVKCTAGECDYKGEMRQVLKDNSNLVSDVFVDSFEIVRNAVLNSIYAICLKLIHEEILRTDFVSLEVDEVNSVGCPVMLVFIVRYELWGEIHERFLRYIITQSNQIMNMSNIISCELKKLAVNKIPEEFISISYNGLTPIFDGRRSGIHSKLKSHFKKIHFIHSYAHDMDFVIEHTSALNKELGIFFINLKSFQAFFLRSENYINILDTIVMRRTNGKFKPTWNFQTMSPTVISLGSYKSEINECLDEIINMEIERSIIAETVALKNLLNDVVFNYWLDFFSKLLSICDELFYLIQKLKAFDAVQVRTIVESFKNKMYHVKNSIPENIDPPPNKRPHIGGVVYIKDEVTNKEQGSRESTRAVMASKVLTVFVAYIEERVAPSPSLLLASLVNPGFFTQYRLAFPRAEVEQIARLFSVDKDILATELQIIYDKDELAQAESPVFLLQYLYEKRITEMFPEVFKLLKMVCTVPMTTSDPGRRFSTLEQIKSFLKSSHEQEKFDVLTMCLLEKDLMKTTPNFNELVIDHLTCQKNCNGVFSCFVYQQLY